MKDKSTKLLILTWGPRHKS